MLGVARAGVVMLSENLRSKEFSNGSILGLDLIASFALQKHLERVQKLQSGFCRELGIKNNSKFWLERSFNPILHRVHVERLVENGDKQGLSDFCQEMRQDLITNLKERYQLSESGGRYLIKNNQLYSPDFPDVSFSTVIKRGVEYRKSQGSTESFREQSELQGFLKIEDFLLRSPVIGSKVISFSPPGKAFNTPYKYNFVDIFTLVVTESGRKIERMRLSVNWSEEKYKEMAKSINPKYFDGYDGRHLDAWFLAHPLVLKNDLDIKSLEGGMEISKFEKIASRLEPLLEKYVEIICQKDICWKDVAISFNSVLNLADEYSKETENKIAKFDGAYRDWRMWGMIYTPTELSSFGCSPSVGFSIIPDILPMPNAFLQNTVAVFGIRKSSSGESKFVKNCGNCGVEINRNISAGYQCSSCNGIYEGC